jgi:hypothetical protein
VLSALKSSVSCATSSDFIAQRCHAAVLLDAEAYRNPVVRECWLQPTKGSEGPVNRVPCSLHRWSINFIDCVVRVSITRIAYRDGSVARMFWTNCVQRRNERIRDLPQRCFSLVNNQRLALYLCIFRFHVVVERRVNVSTRFNKGFTYLRLAKVLNRVPFGTINECRPSAKPLI